MSTTTAHTGGRRDDRLWGRFVVSLQQRQMQRSLINIVAIVAIALAVQGATGKMLIPRNLQSLAVQVCVIAVIAFAQTLVMVAGGIDISVGGVVVMAGLVATLVARTGAPLWVAFLLAVVAGGLIGLFNAALVIWVGITAMIATIGTMFIAQGTANVITNGSPITSGRQDYTRLGTGFVGGVSISLIVILVALALFVFIQRYTVLGRHSVAAGSDAGAAYLAGVNVHRTLVICFALCGAAAGWGGVMYTSRIGAAIPAIDSDLLFQVIVACVVGGTSLTGGEGTILGTLWGAVLIGVVNNGLNLLGVSTYWQDIALGVILVAAVGLDNGLRQNAFFGLRRRFFSIFRPASAATPGHDRGAELVGTK